MLNLNYHHFDLNFKSFHLKFYN